MKFFYNDEFKQKENLKKDLELALESGAINPSNICLAKYLEVIYIYRSTFYHRYNNIAKYREFIMAETFMNLYKMTKNIDNTWDDFYKFFIKYKTLFYYILKTNWTAYIEFKNNVDKYIALVPSNSDNINCDHKKIMQEVISEFHTLFLLGYALTEKTINEHDILTFMDSVEHIRDLFKKY